LQLICRHPQGYLDTTLTSLVQDIGSKRTGDSQPVICLMGWSPILQNHQLQTLMDVVEIVDFCDCFTQLELVSRALTKDPDRAKTAVEWRARRVLSDGISPVTTELRSLLSQREQSKRKLTSDDRDTVSKAIERFESNRDRMRYHEYLAAGYPITTESRVTPADAGEDRRLEEWQSRIEEAADDIETIGRPNDADLLRNKGPLSSEYLDLSAKWTPEASGLKSLLHEWANRLEGVELVVTRTTGDGNLGDSQPPTGSELPIEAELLKIAMEKCQKAQVNAWRLQQYAIQRNGEFKSLPATYEWILKNFQCDAEDIPNELRGYDLPSEATWKRHVTAVRKATGTNVNSRRQGRPHGSTIMKQSEV